MKKNKEAPTHKGVKSKQKGYTIEVKYSKDAEEKKLVKFTTKSGDSFEMSADEMVSLLVNQVNMETLAPTFVETEKVNVVQVSRQLKAVLDKDMKKGTEIRLNYTHPYPLEFALIEEAYKIAKIQQEHGVIELTKEFIDKVKNKLQDKQENFLEKFYKQFKNIDLKKK